MFRSFVFLGLCAVPVLTACGGGSSTPATQPSLGPTQAPTQSPTQAPTQAPAGNMPVQDMVGGAPAWVDPSNHFSLYYIDGDTPPGSACGSGCTDEWPVMVPAAGSQGQGKMVIVTRTDGTTQWSYNGHALYHFAGDSGRDQSNGVYGPWHQARP